MAGFTELERIELAVKALAAGVKDASVRSKWYESVNANKFILFGSSVWTQEDDLLANPAATLTAAQSAAAGPLAGIVQDLSDPSLARRLDPVPGIDNTYVALQTPGDFSSGILDNWVYPQQIPRPNGLPSTGYSMRLYSGDPNAGGTEVLTTDGTTGTGVNKTVGWIWDSATGLLLLSDTFDPFGGNDPYVTGFRYIGDTASDITGGGGAGREHRFQVQLLGTKDAVNKTFTTPEFFDDDSIQVYFNGVRQEKGSGSDYTTSESGGVGTGFDTIVFETPGPAPKADENLFADYLLPL